jgi:hypothetical protein
MPALYGCSAILGDFTESNESPDGGTPPEDASAADGGHPLDAHGTADAPGQVDAPMADAPPPPPVDGGIDAPPPVTGKPGTDLTAGGIIGSSAHFKLYGALGESPGGNIVYSKSASFTLHGGVIAGTQ